MAKRRKKKNYKLRRRVMRTIAALTMVMAIVVAAIPVENYGTMRAAARERTAWDLESGNDYESAAQSFTKLADDPLDGYTNSYTKTIQEVRGGYLSDIAEAWAKNNSSGADAILSGFLSTTGSTELDVKENMFYDYVQYPQAEIRAWVADLQTKGEKYTLKFNHSSAGTVTRNSETVDLPEKFDTANFDYEGSTNSYSNLGASSPYTGFNTRVDDFNAEKIFTGTDALLGDLYTTYLGKINDYNKRVETVAGFQVSSTTTDTQWNDFKSDVEAVKKLFDDQFASGKADEKLEVNVDENLDFSLNTKFYFANFCERVNTRDSNISLKGFTLENCYRSNADGTTTEDIYVAKWNQSNRDDIGSEREKYVDSAGYLAKGSVKIVGIKEKAFKDSQVTTVKLPNSIIAIGDSAFEGSRLSNLEFNSRNCKRIGDKAFYRCNALKSINLTNSGAPSPDTNQTSIEEIGAEAFYDSGITEIVLPDTLKKIYGGCFAESDLKTVDFSAVDNPLEIAEYAFYNCDLNSDGVKFPASREVTIKKAAFAVAYGSSNAMKSFNFPNSTRMDGDYILAGRTSLENVVFPGDLAIEEGTFRNCEGLLSVTLGSTDLQYNGSAGSNVSYKGSGDQDNSGKSAIFADVENPSFCVQGPGFTSSGGSTASRNNTLVLRAGLNLDEDQIFYVPYKFKDNGGSTRVEQKQDENVTAEIKVIDEDKKTAQLTNYSVSNSSGNLTITVPGNVAGYKVTSLGENCFANVIDRMVKLIIEDNSLTEIGDGALKGAKALQEVVIGNSVAKIGADAFADCANLEHVYFNEPLASGDDWSNVMIIADGKDNKGGPAFKTNSNRLTFHGVIKSDYGPFKYAMDSATAGFTNQADGKNICYQSFVKLPEGMKDGDTGAKDIKENASLKVIRDNATGLSTLIDYPHIGTMGTYVSDALGKSDLTEDEARIVNLALNIIVPEGIQSIDAKAYFNDTQNSKNFEYVKESIGGKDLKTLYAKDGEGNDEDCIGGLFSGYFLENGAGLIKQVTRALALLDDTEEIMPLAQLDLKPGTYTEYETRGNDHLTSIVLGSTVSGMPEKYAFDSCENLTKVTLGGAVKDIGKLPFRGCISLEDVAGNGYYHCENRILYGKSNPDAAEGGFDQIVECLETRNNTIDLESDPRLANVKSISDEAFYNCNNGLNEVDLTGSQITQIPKDCFKGAATIQKIVLPESVGSVQEGAFVTGRDPKNGKLDIWVYNQNCDIDAKALSDDVEYRMHGLEWTDNTNTKHTYIYNFAQGHDNVEWKKIEPGYTVTFKDHDGSIIKEVTGLTEGQEFVPPDMDAYLKDHPYEGHVFDYWQWKDSKGQVHTGADAYANVKEDRDIYAIYKVSNDDYNFTGEEVTVNIVGGTLNGNGTMNEAKTSIKIPSGKELFITADTVNGKTFRNWTVSNNFERFLNSQFDTSTTFTVPNPPEGGTITITANFIDGGGQDPDKPNPDGTYNVVVNNGTGSGAYMPGATVTITATPPSVGATFVNWTTTTTGLKLTDPTATTTTFLMPASNVTVTANYTTGGTTNPTTYTVTVKNGTGGGKYAPGATVTIKANTPNTGASFVNWTTATAGVAFASATSATTTFKMPESDVTVTANFSDGTGGQPSDPNNPDNPSGTKKYKATVNYGSGSGEYEAGVTVNISAYAPESSSRVFSKWTTNNSGLGFANANAASTSFVMPAADVTVTANYKVRDDDDDDDDDDRPSRRPGTNTSTNTVTNRPGSSSSTPGSTGTVNNPSSGATGTTDNNGNRIYITKNGISNTDVASLAVSGSTDNFIVRITESPEATAAVEQSLTNTYGTLQGLAYLPMDISLYDSTGQNKITDTHGLNITVTMPIPDVLIQYGGNARVAAADNGGLQQLTPRFTTIDGIACISFVPPHFSPYVIYVDTNNLIAGQMLDATPATGDPIHPKWFAAIGMACISILLFVASDGRRRKNYRAA